MDAPGPQNTRKGRYVVLYLGELGLNKRVNILSVQEIIITNETLHGFQIRHEVS